ncbi:MAG: 30S ribosome-binding factor RbfA, partial [Thermodesulfobacteriota bacterium]
VYFSIYGDECERRDAVEGLKSAGGFIKRTLAQRIRLKHMPELHFSFDDSIEYGDHIEQLIERIRQEGSL